MRRTATIIIAMAAALFDGDAARAETRDAGADASADRVCIYPAPKPVAASTLYRVSVAGKAAFVYRVHHGTIVDKRGRILKDPPETTEPIEAGMCYFDMTGPVDVEVTVLSDSLGPLQSAAVRPLRAGVEAKVSAKERAIRFRIEKPGKYAIEPNGALHGPLMLFAGRPLKEAPRAGDKSIDHYFGPGVHRVGMRKLTSGQTVYIAGGAVVYGQFDADGARDVRIFGRGILDASLAPRKGTKATKKNLGRYRPAIALGFSERVHVEGIHVIDAPTWHVVAWHCREVVFRDLRIMGWRENCDGIDVVSSSKVTIDDCFIRNWDDSIAIKAIPGRGGKRVDCRDVSVRDCVIWCDRAHALEIGFETRAEAIRDVTFRRIDIIHALHLPPLDITNGDGAMVSNIVYEDVRVEDARHPALINIEARRTYTTKEARRGSIREVTFRDCRLPAIEGGHVRLKGEAGGATVSKVRIERLRIGERTIDQPGELKVERNQWAEPARVIGR